MSSSTLGDSVEYATIRGALHLLNGLSLVLLCAGWSLSRAGPLLLSYSERLREFARSRLDEGGQKNGAPNSGVRSPPSENVERSDYQSRGSGVSPPEIKEALASEAQPEVKVDTPKVQINPLSTGTGNKSEKVTAPNPEDAEERLDKVIAEVQEQLDKRIHPSDEIGSMPSPADESREVPQAGNHSEELGDPGGKQGP